MAKTTYLKIVVSIYDKYFRKCYNDMLNRYGSFLNAVAYSDDVKAEVLLIGNHQARHNDLLSWRTEVCKAINKLALAKPWTKNYASFCDIYKDVQFILRGCKYIGDLTIYDVALRLAALYPKYSLMPDKVYLNAGSLKAAKELYKNGHLKKVTPIMDKIDFPTEFHVLRCDEIEDLLCFMQHYGVFSSPINLAKVKTPLGSCFRKNLLAYILLETNWKKAVLPPSQLITLQKRSK